MVQIGTLATEQLPLRLWNLKLHGCLFLLFLFFLLIFILILTILRDDIVKIRSLWLPTSTLPSLFLTLPFEILSFHFTFNFKFNTTLLIQLFLFSFHLFLFFFIHFLLKFLKFYLILNLTPNRLNLLLKKIPRTCLIPHLKIILDCHRFYKSIRFLLCI